MTAVGIAASAGTSQTSGRFDFSMVSQMTESGWRTGARRDLQRIYAAALAAVDPEGLVAGALLGSAEGCDEVPQVIDAARRVFLLSVGKAAASMGLAVLKHAEAKLYRALIVVPPGTADRVREALNPNESRLVVLEAPHPLPDGSSESAADRAVEMMEEAVPDDLLIAAVSGGTSAMLAKAAEGLTLGDKMMISAALLKSGASIDELNTVRRHLSAVKGGQLIRWCGGARVLGLLLSDVPGNDVATIGSGLTAPDPTNFSDAIAVLKRRRLWGRAQEAVRAHLEGGVAGKVPETLKPGDALFARVTNRIIGDNFRAVRGAERAARDFGYTVIMASPMRGEADDVGRVLARRLVCLNEARGCVIAGGEPVVSVHGTGKGGRAQQCALSMAIELDRLGARRRRIAALFAGTDGIDGPTDAAGAFCFSDTVARSVRLGVSPDEALARNDAYHFFDALGDLVVTGPSGTNVADVFVGVLDQQAVQLPQ